jgi:hypothetical protein
MSLICSTKDLGSSGLKSPERSRSARTTPAMFWPRPGRLDRCENRDRDGHGLDVALRHIHAKLRDSGRRETQNHREQSRKCDTDTSHVILQSY